MKEKDKVCKYLKDGMCTESEPHFKCETCTDCYYKISVINREAFSNLLARYRKYVESTTSDREEKLAKEIKKLKERINILRSLNVKLVQENKRLKGKGKKK